MFITADQPVLNFWWTFFTNETPGQGNPFNDQFSVVARGSTNIFSPPIASVNATPMTPAGGLLFTPFGAPGQNQDFQLYTPQWAFYSLDLSALAGQNVTVYFSVDDVGGPHSQSSGFGLDNAQFVASPEPSSVVLGLFAAAGLGIVAIRKRRARRST